MSKLLRIIPRFDIKNNNLIKGVNLEGLRVIGDPCEFAKKYYLEGADEMVFMDAVASLYDRNHLSEITKKISHNIFIPITVGGGIRSLDDAIIVLRGGADKIAINTAAIKNPELINQLSAYFGSQTIVLSIEAKKTNSGFEAYIDNGREKTGVNVKDWIINAQKRGCGEILLTSVDFEGTQMGIDEDLLKYIDGIVEVPLLYSGGFGDLSDINTLYKYNFVDGLVIANNLHYKKINIHDVKEYSLNVGYLMRNE